MSNDNSKLDDSVKWTLFKLVTAYNLLHCKIERDKINQVKDQIVLSAFYAVSESFLTVWKKARPDKEVIQMEDDYNESNYDDEVSFIIDNYKHEWAITSTYCS